MTQLTTKAISNVSPQYSPQELIKEESRIEKKKVINYPLLENLKQLFDEYMRAINYFKENQGDSQCREAILKAKEIKNARELVEQGKDSEVDLMELPGKITPAFICSYSEEERVNKFNEVISEYTRQINEAQKAIDLIIEKIKASPTKDQLKIANSHKEELDKLKGRKTKLGFIIQKFKKILPNPWIPAPLYQVFDEEEKIEKINEDIPLNSIQISLGHCNYDKRWIYAVVKIDDNQKTYTKKIWR